jgi:voltage-gated potassium channel
LRPQIRFWLSLLLVFLVIAAGTVAYMVVLGQPMGASLYMTVITLTTVGYEEVFPLGDTGRWLTIVIILVGYIALAIALANLVSLVVGGELRALREGVRMKTRIEQLHGHVIVCGYGRMGSQLTQQLVRDQVRWWRSIASSARNWKRPARCTCKVTRPRRGRSNRRASCGRGPWCPA